MRFWSAAMAVMMGSAVLAGTVNAQDADLREKVDVLAEEVARLREQMAIPETDEELKGAYGMGPAASKVYGVDQGISLGGYGEFYFAAPVEETEETGATNVTDFYRFITYFGYKFTPSIVMNTELEFEHAGSSVTVEFAYLDFLLRDEINVRAGNLLVPMGFVNEMHEPAFYKGNFRPETERRIIPSTWREMGLGLHGTLGDRVRYTAYALNGLDATGFGASGVRGGRQSGDRAIWEDVAGVVSATYDHDGTAQLGTSFFYGQADQGKVELDGAPIDVNHWIWEAHGEVRHRGLELRGLFAMAHVDDAGPLTEALTASSAFGGLVPEDQIGWYAEAAFDVAPYLIDRGTRWRISPWVRYEDLALQDTVPDVVGRPADESLNTQSLTVGLDVKPHPQVVIKAEYVTLDNDADEPASDEVRLGAGFVY